MLSTSNKRSKTLDFAKLVKQVDWFGCDVGKLQMQLLKDDDKIEKFHEQRQKYYKQLTPRKGVFRTINNQQQSFGMGMGLGLQMTKVQPQQTVNTKAQQHEDILHELSNVTKSLLPHIEMRQKELRHQALIKHREEEEKKFEDKGYLHNYFSEMREQIDQDIRNSKEYFPVPLTKADCLQPNQLYVTPTAKIRMSSEDDNPLTSEVRSE